MQITSQLIATLASMPRRKFMLMPGSTRRTGVILMKFIEPAHAGTIDSGAVERVFDNVHAYYLRSLSVFFAYAFTYENKLIENNKEYVTILRPSAADLTKHTGVRLQHHDQHLNLYESQDGSALLTLYDLSTVIHKEMVRRKKQRTDD